MGKREIVTGATDDQRGRQLNTGTPSAPKLWNFSFRFYRQLEKFGLSKTDPKWFAAVFERLQALSHMLVDDVRSDRTLQNGLRFHQINWGQKNCPMSREELDWLPKGYLDNADSFPMCQFQISMALGRIVGFWDENNVFNVVLLDPLHNIQPSKDYGYKVDDCSPLSCSLTSISESVADAKKSPCLNEGCEARQRLQGIGTIKNEFQVCVLRLSVIDFETADELLTSRPGLTFSGIFESGLLIELGGNLKI